MKKQKLQKVENTGNPQTRTQLIESLFQFINLILPVFQLFKSLHSTEKFTATTVKF